jgi:hypothetical protein
MVKKAKQGLAGIAVTIAIVLAAVAGLALIPKQSATNGQTEPTTLSGVVTQGPTTPICSDAQPCTSPVANHTIQALDSQSNLVATAATNGMGEYSFHLKPGHYILQLVPQVGSLTSRSNQVDVTDSPKQFNITIDSGIR